MRVFLGGIITESNSFAPAPTGIQAFEDYGPSLIDLVSRHAERGGHELVVSSLVAAQPNGTTLRSAYESLRDRLLEDLREALPVDAVILPLHGAMVAEGYPDCEGDLIQRVRGLVGTQTPIGVELDLHCHFTETMRVNADLIIAFKEYPHTDMHERMDELWHLVLATARRQIRPTTGVFDCRMVGMWHTTREPMKSFVERMAALEGEDGILSVSFGHGFPWGDVPEAGAKVWVVTDGDLPLAQRLAERLGRELWRLRDETKPPLLQLDRLLDRLEQRPASDHPLVVADTADNPGGGAAGDSTFVLRGVLDRKIGGVAIGAFWDLGAIQICLEAGVGAKLDLRLGGKCGPASGMPVDLTVTVRSINLEHSQFDVEISRNSCGPSVWISTDDGVDIVLISRRQQVMGSDIFTGLGIDLSSKKAVILKSTQHFYTSFSPIASEVLYVDTPGLLRGDYENIPYRHRDPNYWPRVPDPHGWDAN